MQFVSPKTKRPLSLNRVNNRYETSDTSEVYYIDQEVVKFLDKQDEFYEGAYISTSKWLPKSENWYHRFPLSLLNSGYVSKVRREVPENATILEIGCGGGISYFAKRYNVIGLDLSFKSLLNAPYKIKLQADALNLPLEDNSIDAVVSCSFWEHISTDIKHKMLREFRRVLKPGGKLVFFYDVETNNSLIGRLKKTDPEMYNDLFILKDGHLGYHTPAENKLIFLQEGFKLKLHFGKERTNILALSALEKLRQAKKVKIPAGIFTTLNKSPFIHMYYFFLHCIDNSIGRLFSPEKSRVMLTVAVKP